LTFFRARVTVATCHKRRFGHQSRMFALVRGHTSELMIQPFGLYLCVKCVAAAATWTSAFGHNLLLMLPLPMLRRHHPHCIIRCCWWRWWWRCCCCRRSALALFTLVAAVAPRNVARVPRQRSAFPSRVLLLFNSLNIRFNTSCCREV
jgi:hypothetical protein